MNKNNQIDWRVCNLDTNGMPITIEISEKIGRWVQNEDEIFCKYRCSVCGKSAIYHFAEYFLTDYCPNCGAKMFIST